MIREVSWVWSSRRIESQESLSVVTHTVMLDWVFKGEMNFSQAESEHYYWKIKEKNKKKIGNCSIAEDTLT